MFLQPLWSLVLWLLGPHQVKLMRLLLALFHDVLLLLHCGMAVAKQELGPEHRRTTVSTLMVTQTTTISTSQP